MVIPIYGRSPSTMAMEAMKQLPQEPPELLEFNRQILADIAATTQVTTSMMPSPATTQTEVRIRLLELEAARLRKMLRKPILS